MTDAEIIRAVAVELFGGCRVDQDGSVFIDDLNGPFLPLTNANHTLLVIERMRDLGWYFTCEYFTLGLIEAGFIYKKTLPNRPQKVIEYHESFDTAVCLAALKALEEK